MNHTDLLLKYFSLSISAHNSQPFKLKALDESSFEIIVDHKRHLPVADPHQRDLQIGLGALLATLQIGLSQDKLELRNTKVTPSEQFSHERDFKIASFEIQSSSASESELVPQLERRFSYRGKFKYQIPTPDTVFITQDLRLKFLSTKDDKKSVGKLYDKVNVKFLTSKGYIEELYSWLRFSTSHPQYYKDGLNVESMGLGKVDGLGASYVLKPSVFRSLAKTGVAPSLVAETPIIESASAVVAIIGKEKSPLAIGDGFMKGWLKLSEFNLFGAPLSLLTDDEEAVKQIRLLFKVKADETIYNILRVGPLPKGYHIPKRARLSKEELYV